ncbi:hypothetical protein TruAng_009914 [Truncatella angustata]|nr:hypothetical protein TruAng_009914 [Truncatella angustata]
MLALQAQDTASGLSLKEAPVPSLGPNDVLIKVHSAGITPGVVKLLKMGQSAVPTIVGHEAAGLVAEIGEQVNDVVVGTRVRVHPILSCGECYNCQRGVDSMCDESAQMGFAKFGEKTCHLYEKYHDGALAEYVRVPRQFVDQLPDNVSFEVGAKMHDVATALSVLKLADISKPNSTIILTAPTGTMGTSTLKLAKFFPNLKRIILVGRSRERLESLQRLSPVETIVFPMEPSTTGPPSGPPQHGPPQFHPAVAQLKKLAPDGICSIIDYTPAGPGLGQILPALSTGGTLIHMGGNGMPLPLPLVVIMAKCWRIMGSRAHNREDAKEVLNWLSSGALDFSDLITHRFSLEEVHKAVDKMESRDEPVWMSVITVS